MEQGSQRLGGFALNSTSFPPAPPGSAEMVEEKQKAEEKEREAEQAAKEETAEAGLAQAAGPEPERGLEPPPRRASPLTWSPRYGPTTGLPSRELPT